MMRRNRRAEEFSLSFLDVICCGFGAIILLLLITKTVKPVVLEEVERDLAGVMKNLQSQLFEVRGETKVLNRDLNAKHEQLSEYEDRVARLKRELSELKGEFDVTEQDKTINDVVLGELLRAKQSLTDEMKRLLANRPKKRNDYVGGIPVDSEYIIFVIDTSGSMFNYSWDKVQDQLVNVLNIYPQVKGLQVMNDMGDYMFSRYRGSWIPDTAARRKSIITRLKTWNPFSNSSPVEGITNAVRTFYAPDKKISIYVFGDEFSGNSIAEVVNTIDRINKADKAGERLVRIHAIGFPVQFSAPPHLQTTGIRFAALMRELTRRNGGTFVGLNEFY